MKDFTEIDPIRVLLKNDHFFVIKDAFPVSPGHMLIISNEVKRDYFDLSETEKNSLSIAILKAKSIIEKENIPDGYNIGMNCGEAAGQTVFHFHCHLIPRYKGDVENPRGGVRGVVPGKREY